MNKICIKNNYFLEMEDAHSKSSKDYELKQVVMRICEMAGGLNRFFLHIHLFATLSTFSIE